MTFMGGGGLLQKSGLKSAPSKPKFKFKKWTNNWWSVGMSDRRMILHAFAKESILTLSMLNLGYPSFS